MSDNDGVFRMPSATKPTIRLLPPLNPSPPFRLAATGGPATQEGHCPLCEAGIKPRPVLYFVEDDPSDPTGVKKRAVMMPISQQVADQINEAGGFAEVQRSDS